MSQTTLNVQGPEDEMDCAKSEISKEEVVKSMCYLLHYGLTNAENRELRKRYLLAFFGCKDRNEQLLALVKILLNVYVGSTLVIAQLENEESRDGYCQCEKVLAQLLDDEVIKPQTFIGQKMTKKENEKVTLSELTTFFKCNFPKVSTHHTAATDNPYIVEYTMDGEKRQCSVYLSDFFDWINKQENKNQSMDEPLDASTSKMDILEKIVNEIWYFVKASENLPSNAQCTNAARMAVRIGSHLFFSKKIYEQGVNSVRQVITSFEQFHYRVKAVSLKDVSKRLTRLQRKNKNPSLHTTLEAARKDPKWGIELYNLQLICSFHLKEHVLSLLAKQNKHLSLPQLINKFVSPDSSFCCTLCCHVTATNDGKDATQTAKKICENCKFTQIPYV